MHELVLWSTEHGNLHFAVAFLFRESVEALGILPFSDTSHTPGVKEIMMLVLHDL